MNLLKFALSYYQRFVLQQPEPNNADCVKTFAVHWFSKQADFMSVFR